MAAGPSGVVLHFCSYRAYCGHVPHAGDIEDLESAIIWLRACDNGAVSFVGHSRGKNCSGGETC